MRASAAVAVVMAGLSTGCATKSYVRHEVAAVNERVDVVSTEAERTQQRVLANEARIAEADARAQSAERAAAEAVSRAEAAERAARGKLVYDVTLSNDEVTFPLNAAVLSDEARARIDALLAPFLAANRGILVEIEGHTDATGDADDNLRLGEIRALAVRDYLHSAHRVALARMAVISVGEARPIADNGTLQGRARNRRVVIRLLE